jgi:hypothetical protein
VFSPDGKYLAVSLKQRGSLWDLDTNKQIILMRPFRSAWMGNDDRLFAQLSKFRDQDPADLVARMSPPGAKSLGKYEADEWQYRDLQFQFKPMGKEKITTHHATLEVKKMETQAVAWTRDYPHETPACWPAEDDRMVLGFDLSSETAKAEVKNFPALQSEVAALGSKKKGLLLETVNSETGSPLEQVIVPEADLSQGWNDARRATVSGEVVLARGEHGNTVIYRFKDGAKVGEFFGTAVATDARTGFIAAVNREDEVLLVDELTGQERQRFRFGSPVRLTRIVSGNGGALLVLTADQVVHRLPLPQ